MILKRLTLTSSADAGIGSAATGFVFEAAALEAGLAGAAGFFCSSTKGMPKRSARFLLSSASSLSLGESDVVAVVVVGGGSIACGAAVGAGVGTAFVIVDSSAGGRSGRS